MQSVNIVLMQSDNMYWGWNNPISIKEDQLWTSFSTEFAMIIATSVTGKYCITSYHVVMIVFVNWHTSNLISILNTDMTIWSQMRLHLLEPDSIHVDDQYNVVPWQQGAQGTPYSLHKGVGFSIHSFNHTGSAAVYFITWTTRHALAWPAR